MMKEIRFSIEIKASKKAVWAALWEDTTFRTWANFIDEGTYIEGEIAEGREIQFLSAENGYGVTSLVHTYRECDFVIFMHNADTQQFGQQLRPEEWTGGRESYELVENDGTTTLLVKMDVPLEMEALFLERFPKAMACIKSLSEGRG